MAASRPQQPVRQVFVADVAQVRQRHRRQTQVAFATGEGVFEFGRRAERGRAGCDNPRLREMIGRDLEQFRGISQPVDFIQHDALAGHAFQKRLRVFHLAAHPGQFAVKVFHAIQRLAEAGLAHPTQPGQPDDGALRPGRLDQLNPLSAFYHARRL